MGNRRWQYRATSHQPPPRMAADLMSAASDVAQRAAASRQQAASRLTELPCAGKPRQVSTSHDKPTKSNCLMAACGPCSRLGDCLTNGIQCCHASSSVYRRKTADPGPCKIVHQDQTTGEAIFVMPRDFESRPCRCDGSRRQPGAADDCRTEVKSHLALTNRPTTKHCRPPKPAGFRAVECSKCICGTTSGQCVNARRQHVHV
jgi:hypothetical protein